jgi:hypothetical protein
MGLNLGFISASDILALTEFGISFGEISAMELGDLLFWVEELTVYCEPPRD